MDHLFQPGNEFGKGRPLGAPNKRTNELRIRLQNRGDIDPAEFCSSIVSNPNEPTELRLAASNYLLPYLYAKRGAVPTPRYIDEPIQLPEPLTIEQATKNIAYISDLKAQGLIDLDFANSLIADNQAIANNLIAEEELKFKINPPAERDQTITITGGLPALPGTNINMSKKPSLNGHPPAPMIEDQGKEIIPAQLKAEGPHPLQERYFKPDDPGKNSNGGGTNSTPDQGP